MTALVGYLSARRGADGLLAGGFQFGDWLDPDAPGDRPHEAKTSADYLANAFFAHSARILSAACEVLGEPDAARRYAELAAEVARSTWDRWREHALSTQTGCAVALELGAQGPVAIARVLRVLDEGALPHPALELLRVEEPVVAALALARARGTRGGRHGQPEPGGALEQPADQRALPHARGTRDDEDGRSCRRAGHPAG